MSDTQGAAEKALQKLSEQLNCTVCLDNYQDPKTLPCLHVFCRMCLEKVVSRDGTTLTCPICRKMIRLAQDGILQLPTAFYITHLFDLRNTLEKVQTEAINVVPTKKSVSTCSKHPGKVLEVYCENCEELVCHNCTVKTHREHEYDLVVECFPKHRDRIIASLQPVKQQLDTVSQAVGDMDARIRRLTDQSLSTKQSIQDEIDRLHDTLEARKRELMASVDQIVQTAEKAYQAQLKSYELTKTHLSSYVEYVEESLRTGSPEEILSVKKQVVETVKGIAEEFESQTFQPEPEHILQFSHQQLPVKACQQFGEVLDLCTPLCPEKSYATGTGLQSTLRGVPVTLTLHTVDTREQPCTDSKTSVSGELVSRGDGGVVKCGVTRMEDNTYELKYQPHTTGEHDLHVKVYGRHIKNSPFTVTVGGFQGIYVKTIEGFETPRQLAITADGEMVVAETSAHRISVLDQNGQKLRSFGDIGSPHSKLRYPHGVALCSDDTVVVAAEHCVKKFTLEGKFIISRSIRDRTSWITTLFEDVDYRCHSMSAVAVNSTTTKVYMCDTDNHQIHVLNSDLSFSNTFGSRGSGRGQFDCPYGIAVDTTGNLYIADSYNNRIQIFGPSGQYRQIKERGPGMGTLRNPVCVCIDSQNFLYILEGGRGCVSVFNSEGNFVRHFGHRGGEAGEFRNPSAIAVNTAGIVYVSDTGNNRIQMFR